MRPSVSNSFQALPPILSGSSVHFHTNLDFNFQSFMISSGNAPRSRRASRLSETPPALPPLPSLSQPLFPPVAETTQKDLFQIPSLRHPNSPYVPWDSPMRRQIFLTPESSDLLPGHTENVTRVPEPMDLLDGSQKVVKSSWGIGKVHRTVKNVAGFAKRMFMRQKQARVSAASPLVAINTHLSDGSFNPPVYPPSPGVASFDSSNTRSLALWLDARRQETLEWDADSRHFITLEEYERRGSWTNFAGERDFVCSVPGCSIHSRLSNAITTIDLELNVLSCDQQVDDNVEQQQDMDVHRVSHDSDKTAVSEENPHEKSEELESFVLRGGC
ncbi:hypothetical protein F5878DRAFT_632145 [Lentinula raphanica]|uniref:Uncharacterized protein n=1 Tax=Lentinula raphanica TaxID=153919 RepID=A0AA38P073_9AGAR|nr:hypothetical protein F5880DRAFT_458203 [Lentinula raphanica]KAJ3833770.1 hypothetical protein F5878DRAFT_632145 [Lentinula raphanica]